MDAMTAQQEVDASLSRSDASPAKSEGPSSPVLLSSENTHSTSPIVSRKGSAGASSSNKHSKNDKHASNNSNNNSNEEDSVVPMASKDMNRIMKKLLAASNDGTIKSDMKTLALVYKLDRMKYKHKQEMMELKATYKTKEQKHKEENQLQEQVKKELVNLYNEFNYGVKMVGGLKEEIELLRNQLSSSNETTEQRVNVYRTENDKLVHELRSSHKNEVDNLVQQHTAKCEQMAADHASQMHKTTTEHSEQTEMLNKTHETAVQDLKDAHAALMASELAKMQEEMTSQRQTECEKLRKEAEDMEAGYVKELEMGKMTQSEQVTLLKYEIEQIKQAHADLVEQLHASHSSDMASARESHAAEHATARSTHAGELAALADAHAKQVEVLISTQQLYQREIERLKLDAKEFEERSRNEYDTMVQNLEKKRADEVEHLTSTHASERDTSKQSSDAHVSQLTEEHDARVNELSERANQERRAWEDKFEMQEEANTAELSRLHEDYQNQIQDLQQEIERLHSEWESTKVTTQKEQELNTQSNLQMILSLNSQRSQEIQGMHDDFMNKIAAHKENEREYKKRLAALEKENETLRRKHPCLYGDGHHSHSHSHSPSNSRPGSPGIHSRSNSAVLASRRPTTPNAPRPSSSTGSLGSRANSPSPGGVRSRSNSLTKSPPPSRQQRSSSITQSYSGDEHNSDEEEHHHHHEGEVEA